MTLFDVCYKRGVEDARAAHDPYLCEEFIAITNIPGNYGFICKTRLDEISTDTWDIRQFVNELHYLAQYKQVQSGVRALLNTLFKTEKQKTYYRIVLDVSQEFYNQGLKDYNANPYSNDMEEFLQTRRMKWGERKLQKRDISDFYSDICIAIYDRQILHEENKNKHSITRRRFEKFQRAIWGAMQTIEEWQL